MSALAAGVALFPALATPSSDGRLVARKVVVELPYTGPPVVLPQRGIFATSRLTVVGDDPAEVHATIVAFLESDIDQSVPDGLPC